MSSVDRPIVTVLPGGTTGTGSNRREIPDSKVKIAVPMTLIGDGSGWVGDPDTAARCTALGGAVGEAASAAAGTSVEVDVARTGTRATSGAGAAIGAAADGASVPPAPRSAIRLREPTPRAGTGFVGGTSEPAAEARGVGFAGEAADSGAVVPVDGGVKGVRLGPAAVVVTVGVVSTDGDAAASYGGLIAGLGQVAVVTRPVGIPVVVVGGADAGLVASAGFVASVGDSVAAILAGSDRPVGRDGVVPMVCWH